jgi:hypothetical protein
MRANPPTCDLPSESAIDDLQASLGPNERSQDRPNFVSKTAVPGDIVMCRRKRQLIDRNHQQFAVGNRHQMVRWHVMVVTPAKPNCRGKQLIFPLTWFIIALHNRLCKRFFKDF